MKLTAENLVKQYPKKRALDDVSFELTEGVYGLLGPNGAGKTTLINIIAGILRPTSGRVLWDGEDIGAIKIHFRVFLQERFKICRCTCEMIWLILLQNLAKFSRIKLRNENCGDAKG